MKEFAEKYGYKINAIRVSDIIKERAQELGETIPSEETQRIATLQRIGSERRRDFSPAYWAEKCVEKIAVHRQDNKGYAGDVPVPQRQVHIIDSLKNPAEVELFRKVYGDNFWLVGVFAPEGVRKQRLRNLDHAALQQLMDTDEEEGSAMGNGWPTRCTSPTSLSETMARMTSASKPP